MIHGLLWLPLLAVFIVLTWAGWNEYQKLEAYRVWAQPFDHAKYDIYAVLGQKGDRLVWGKPTRRTPIDLHTLSLSQVQSVHLLVGQQRVDLHHPPENSNQRIALELRLNTAEAKQIPFTDLELAIDWGKRLELAIGRASQSEQG